MVSSNYQKRAKPVKFLLEISKKRGKNYWRFFYFLKNQKENYFAFFIENNTS
jgi:hypothetical protein